MKTLHKNTTLAILATTIVASTLSADQKEVSYADIKSKIMQNEREVIIQKRDKLAKNVADRETIYLSNIIDTVREANRIKR